MNIETKRCIIRRFDLSDIDSFMSYRNDETWMMYQGFKGLSKESYIEKLLVEPDYDKGAQLAIYSPIENDLIGDLFLLKESEIYWIGYTIHPKYARKGYASEVVEAMVERLRFKGVKKVYAGVHPENINSIKLLQKLSFNYLDVDEYGDDVYVRKLL